MSGLASLLGGAGAGRSRQAAGTGRTRPTPPADGGSSTPAAPATPTTVPVPAPAPGGAGQSSNPIQLSDLQSILSNIQVCCLIVEKSTNSFLLINFRSQLVKQEQVALALLLTWQVD